MAELQTDHAAALLRLGRELLPADSLATLLRISAADPVDRAALIEFDDGLLGPSLSRIADNRPDAPGTLGIPRHGSTRCDVQDRDVFRPLHYCAVYLTDPDLDIAWVARSIVEMSSAHLEQLVKRIGPPRFMPLGVLLRETIVRRSIEPATCTALSTTPPNMNSLIRWERISSRSRTPSSLTSWPDVSASSSTRSRN